jgi:hypothetical protein
MCVAYELDGMVSIIGESKIFLLFTASRPTLGSTKPSSQSPHVYPQEARRPECYADYCLFVMTKFRQSVAIPPLPYTSSITQSYVFTYLCFIWLGKFLKSNVSTSLPGPGILSALYFQNPSVSVLHPS